MPEYRKSVWGQNTQPIEVEKEQTTMRAIRFNPEKDLPPIPFNERICRLASDLKKRGLNWRPHVGCFVWDPNGFIKQESPFPGRIYFILSLPRFIDIFDSLENMVEKLVWLPTWHQARILCEQLGLMDDDLANDRRFGTAFSPGEDLYQIYRCIGDALQKRESAK